MKKCFSLPRRPNVGRFDDRDLERLTNLVYAPVSGIVYRKRYEMACSFLPPGCGKILEIGFGAGLLVPALSKRCRFVCGIDIHREIRRAAEMLSRENIPNAALVNADIARIPFKDDTFDVAVCLSMLEHLKNPDEAMGEVARVLRRGGRAVLGFPVKNRLTKMLFAALGYDDEHIHPSGHTRILRSASGVFQLERSVFYPGFLGPSCALYCVSSFRKNA